MLYMQVNIHSLWHIRTKHKHMLLLLLLSVHKCFLLSVRFRTFEHSLKDISDLLEVWDRTTLQIRRPRTPSERSEEEHGKDQPASGRKGKGKGMVYF